ncbi:MAG: ATP-binding protein [Pseudomonadota bacterium]
MAVLKTLVNSIVARVTAITVFSMFFVFFLIWILMQTPLADRLYARILADNADNISELVWLIETSPREIQPFIVSAYKGPARAAAIVPEMPPDARQRPQLLKFIEVNEGDMSQRLIGGDIRFRILKALQMRQQTANDPLTYPQSLKIVAVSVLEVSMPLDDGRVLLIRLAPAVVLNSQVLGGALISMLVLAFALALSFALAIVMLGPVRRLERDADRIGLIEAGAGISENGPIELRRIARALNRMHKRLGGLILERSQIGAAIAHDIRTGLTKLRLRFYDDDTVSLSKIEGDLTQMETLITDMLSYARAESPEGPRELVRIGSFVKDVAQSAPIPIVYEASPAADRFEIAGDPVALRRLFDNLIENARRYGEGEIRIEVIKGADQLNIRVLDNGPGLPADQLEAMFEPFRRMEASRSRGTGGSGLGLGIARSIARAHGATLRLENRQEGGLAAILSFPDALKT